jgi:4-amino-4-deoxy-L-arabinose transferase-like glycosyltransferase
MNNLYLIGIVILAGFFAFFKIGTTPLQDGVESRNGVNAIEMLQTGDVTSLTYGTRTDVWNVKPPLTIWLTALSFKTFGYTTFAARFPAALATIFIFLFLYRLIRLYQDADFAFFSCLVLLSVKGLVGRHISDLGEYDAVFTCFAVAGTYYFLKYFDLKNKNALYWSAACFGLSFMSKGFGIFGILLGVLVYAAMRHRLKELFTQRSFFIGIMIFLCFPLLWLAMNSWSIEATFAANIRQEFLSYLTQFQNRNWLLFFDYLAVQYEWWHYLFFISMPVGFYLVYFNQSDLEQNFTTSVSNFEPTPQLPRSPLFTIGELLARNDLKPNIQLLLCSICIWLILGIICTISQNGQYLAFALPFIAITSAASIFYLNHRYEWFRYIFIALIAFTFWGQLDYYVKNQTYPNVIFSNEEVIRPLNSIGCDGDLPSQDVLLYLYLIRPDLNIVMNEDETSEVILCRTENIEKYKRRSVIYQDEAYALLLLRTNDKIEM